MNRRRSREAGYLIVLFVLVIAFVGVAAAMQVLVLTSVSTTSRAYDTFRQGASEAIRFERVVTEALLDIRQISAATSPLALPQALQTRLDLLCPGGSVVATSLPATVPKIAVFPDAALPPDPLGAVTPALARVLTPELLALCGSRVCAYPELRFEFGSTRRVLDATRVYATEVRATLVAVPLTRFPIAAYELPPDVAVAGAQPGTGPESALPAGASPGRDASFITDVQWQPGTLPYHFRRRAALAAAYQYVFSPTFNDRVAEYAGVTHYHNLDPAVPSGVLTGMTDSGAVTTWDLGAAGPGTFNTIHATRDAAVLFTTAAGRTLRVFDSVGTSSAPALLLVVLGPVDLSLGPLALELGSIERPVVIVASNVRVRAASGASVNGALFLDPQSSVAAGGTFSLGHFSYWAGSRNIPRDIVATRPLSTSAEAIAPRVVHVATLATRL